MTTRVFWECVLIREHHSWFGVSGPPVRVSVNSDLWRYHCVSACTKLLKAAGFKERLMSDQRRVGWEHWGLTADVRELVLVHRLPP